MGVEVPQAEESALTAVGHCQGVDPLDTRGLKGVGTGTQRCSRGIDVINQQNAGGSPSSRNCLEGSGVNVLQSGSSICQAGLT